MADEIDRDRRSGIADGDAEAWRCFAAGQVRVLYGLFMKRWPNPSLAEELVQKTLFDAVRGRATYDPSRGSPGQWIAGIARNNIRLEIRRRAGQPTVDGDMAAYFEAIDARPMPDELLERRETVELVHRALGRLADKERAVLLAKYTEDLSAEAIARRTGTTAKGVHSLLYRAKASLRKQLQKMAATAEKE